MEFRRIPGLPPYVFTIIDGLKIEARRAGRDVIDLGFGNPDMPVAGDRGREAGRGGAQHAATTATRPAAASRSCARRSPTSTSASSASTLDPETEVITTIGAKEGFSHLMWVLLQPGDAALVPSPSYPIHIWGPLLRRRRRAAGARCGDRRGLHRNVMRGLGARLAQAAGASCCRSRTTRRRRRVELADHAAARRLGPRARRGARARLRLRRRRRSTAGTPPSILQCEGAKECAVELYSMTKSFSMAGWRVAFLVGNAEVVAALAKLKSYLDYGTFQPIQIAATVTMNEAPDYPAEVNAIYESRRNALVDGLARIGWDGRAAAGHDVRLGADPRAVPRAWARSSSPR